MPIYCSIHFIGCSEVPFSSFLYAFIYILCVYVCVCVYMCIYIMYVYIYTILPKVLGHPLLNKGLTILAISMSTNLNV